MKAASPAEQVRKQPDSVSNKQPFNDYNNTNSGSAKKKETPAQQSQKRQWLAPSSSNDELTQKQPQQPAKREPEQPAKREPEKPKEPEQPKTVTEKPKEEKKTSLFKGGSTNPFVNKRNNEPVAPKKEEFPLQKKKSSSSEIKEEYSGGFIEDVYDDDFI